MKKPLICLASASSRRHELLLQIGVEHLVHSADIDETPLPHEAVNEYVLRLALEKARAVRAERDEFVNMPVLGSDTAVVADGEILGKPNNKSHGLEMLRQLSGKTHQVLTSVAMVSGALESTRLSVSQVRFRHLSERELECYWQTGEPLDKAGGYGIQGYAAAFIEHLDGSFSGVMGLPLYETVDLLNEFGIAIDDVWAQPDEA